MLRFSFIRAVRCVRLVHSTPSLSNDFESLRKKAREMKIDPQVLRDAERILGPATELKSLDGSPATAKEPQVIQFASEPDLTPTNGRSKSSRTTLKPPEGWRKNLKLPLWKRHKYAIWEKFEGQRWNPDRKLSRDQMDSVRLLKQAMPNMTAAQLSKEFRTSPEAVAKILKSKWKPFNDEEAYGVKKRWVDRQSRVAEILGAERNREKKLVIKTGSTFTSVKRTSANELVHQKKLSKGIQKGDASRLFTIDGKKKKNTF